MGDGMMVFLIDALTVIIPVVITIVLYILYYQIFVKGYVRRIKKATERKDYEKAEKMKAIALKRQPRRMRVLLMELELGKPCKEGNKSLN